MRHGEMVPGVFRNLVPLIVGLMALWANACSKGHSHPAGDAEISEASVPEAPIPQPDGSGDLWVSVDSCDGLSISDVVPPLDGGNDGPTCHSVSSPSVMLESSDRSQWVVRIQVLEGPCWTASNVDDRSVLRFSSVVCPSSLSDRAVCTIEVTSNLGNTATLDVAFGAQMLAASVYYWVPASGGIVTFPPRDGGSDAPKSDASTPDGAINERGDG